MKNLFLFILVTCFSSTLFASDFIHKNPGESYVVDCTSSEDAGYKVSLVGTLNVVAPKYQGYGSTNIKNSSVGIYLSENLNDAPILHDLIEVHGLYMRESRSIVLYPDDNREDLRVIFVDLDSDLDTASYIRFNDKPYDFGCKIS